jgi:hypothetical protein
LDERTKSTPNLSEDSDNDSFLYDEEDYNPESESTTSGGKVKLKIGAHCGGFVAGVSLELWIMGIVDHRYWGMSFWIVDPLVVDQRSKTRCTIGFLRLCG